MSIETSDVAGQAIAALWPIIQAHPGYVRLALRGFVEDLDLELLEHFVERAPIIAWRLEPNGPFPIADNDESDSRPEVWAVRRPDGSVFLPRFDDLWIGADTFESEAELFKYLAARLQQPMTTPIFTI
jgi:hypothetical protein